MFFIKKMEHGSPDDSTEIPFGSGGCNGSDKHTNPVSGWLPIDSGLFDTMRPVERAAKTALPKASFSGSNHGLEGNLCEFQVLERVFSINLEMLIKSFPPFTDTGMVFSSASITGMT